MVNNHIEVISSPVDELLAQLRGRTGDMEPFLRALGESMSERIKERFGAGRGPDGVPWKANSPTTLAKYIQSRGGKNQGKRRQTAPAKKPLIAHGDMSRGIHYQADQNGVLVASPAPQAFMMHFGGSKADFPHLWGDIPARPFFPIQPNGALYPAEEEEIIEELQHYLTLG